MPGATLGQLIGRLAKEYNKRLAPPQSITRECEFKDKLTGRICGSRYQVERDHITPKAKGGSDAPHNRRPLCKKHNQYVAELEFGREFMEQKRRLP